MYAAFARDQTHGISMLVLAKLLRLIGVDQLHIGTVVGKMEGGRGPVLDCHATLNQQDLPATPDRFAQSWGTHGTVFSVASGGLSPLHLPALVEIFGTDVIIQAGGGVHGHPDGTTAGARALRQSLDAAVAGTPLAEAATTAPELARALERWG
jgi:ribulose-bisphosphate carboxylase large chain